jgi:predicted RNA-binding Zn ribbon-like protein
MQQIPAIVIADAPALDFLNSVATPVDVPVEWLDDGDGLVSWLQQARLVPAPLLQEMRSRALPGELDDVAERARSLREWFRGFVHKHRGRPLSGEDLKELEPLNRLLERDESFHQIAPAPARSDNALHGDNVFELQAARRWRSPEALLFPIAEILAQFVCSEDFTHVKACEGPACTLLFADHTRGRARRWCSMAICGNRAKQAAHRRRLKAHH